MDCDKTITIEMRYRGLIDRVESFHSLEGNFHRCLLDRVDSNWTHLLSELVGIPITGVTNVADDIRGR